MMNISFKTIVVFLWSDQAYRLKDEHLLCSQSCRHMIGLCYGLASALSIVPISFQEPFPCPQAREKTLGTRLALYVIRGTVWREKSSSDAQRGRVRGWRLHCLWNRLYALECSNTSIAYVKPYPPSEEKREGNCSPENSTTPPLTPEDKRKE